MDPYKVLRLSKNFTLDELKSNYKRLALQLHPDKNALSEKHAAEIFKILTRSYKMLLDAYEMRVSDKQFNELKAYYENMESSTNTRNTNNTTNNKSNNNNNKSNAPTRTMNKSIPSNTKTTIVDPERLRNAMTSQFSSSQGFNHDKFNAFFNENKVSDKVQETGYGDWLKSEKVHVREKTAKYDNDCKDMMLHLEPLELGKSRLAYSTMGDDDVDDFSMSTNRVVATDLRVAYSGDNIEKEALAMPMRKEWTSVDELKSARANVKTEMSSQERMAYDKYRSTISREDDDRRSRVLANDRYIEDNFQRVTNRLTAN